MEKIKGTVKVRKSIEPKGETKLARHGRYSPKKSFLKFLLNTEDYVMGGIRRTHTKWLLKRKERKGSQLIYYDELKFPSSFTS